MIIFIILLLLLVFIGGGIWLWPLLAGVLGLSIANDRPSALLQIRQLMETHEITVKEVETAFNTPVSNNSTQVKRSSGDIAKTLFSYLGGIFILAGLGTYIATFWDSMGSIMRISVTLGVSYILFIVLVSALYEKKFPRAILLLTTACAFMMVVGWLVVLEELFPKSTDWRPATLFICGIIAVHWGALFAKFQRTYFAVIALFFSYGFMQVGLDMLGLAPEYIAIFLGSSLFLVGTTLIEKPRPLVAELSLLSGAIWLNQGVFILIADCVSPEWANLLVGISFMSAAYGLHLENRYKWLVGLGYIVGSAMFYTGLFTLVQHSSIELIYFAITASMLYACVVLQSRSLLLTTVLAMLSYIGYFSATHFVDSLGWPITLVLIGIAFLAVGTLAIKLKKQI